MAVTTEASFRHESMVGKRVCDQFLKEAFPINIDEQSAADHKLEPKKEVQSPNLETAVFVLDLSTTDDYSMCEVTTGRYAECTEDIHHSLREAEKRNRPRQEYMKGQPDINSNMRSVVVDWLVEVAEEFECHRETLFLCVSYMDRYLSSVNVSRDDLQLVGTACFFIASKYEEIEPPALRLLIGCTDCTYNKKELLDIERHILKVLSFELTVPTTNCFCELYLRRIGADKKTDSFAMYLAELTLISNTETYLKYPPSVISAAVTCLANFGVNDQNWNSALERATQYVFNEIEPCLLDLRKTFLGAATFPQQAVRAKYQASKFFNVSSLSLPNRSPWGEPVKLINQITRSSLDEEEEQ